MKAVKILLFIVHFFISFCSIGQDSLIVKNVLAFTPTTANRVNGLSIGLWNDPNYDYQQFNGINIELIGKGWLTP
ncbi:MAG: hypothetical protein JNK41_12760 [Saprospiraceae bacterium]|nr:hypothetical protein [Saprospiraceae bacterium]